MQDTSNKIVHLHDKKFAPHISATQIDAAIQKIAIQINTQLAANNPLFICVLNGVFIFAADLLRKIEIPCEISFIKVSSYNGTASLGEVKTQIGLKEDIKGRTIVIVEDIIDSGNTIDKLLPVLQSQQPEQIKIATLLFKPSAFKKSFKIDYTGIQIPNDFVVGYGLDYNGMGRNLPEIYKIVE